MESQIKSSFIPPDTGAVPQPRRSKKSGGVDLALLAGVILLVASLAIAVGVFLYVQYLENSLASKQEQLERARAAFEPSLIEELTRLDNRLTLAGDLLYNHTAPSELFRVLEELTLETVSFRDMQFMVESPSRMSLTLSGDAASVNSIALQADLFGKHTAISSPIFSNINRAQNGIVQFDVSALINPNAIKYVNVFRARSTGGLEQQTTSTPPPAPGQTGESTAPETAEEEESAIPVFVP